MGRDYTCPMSTQPYFPDLDDGDFRRLIDARRLVVIKFWSEKNGEKSPEQGAFVASSERHPEVVFAQCNVDLHHNLVLRTNAPPTPSIQGWVDGNLKLSCSGDLDEHALESFIQEIKTTE